MTGGGHRALVFSQFTGFLGKVREQLDAAGIPYCYLDGQTRNRAAVLQRFRDGTAPVFLISLKAGGFGLNLTEADYCFLLDPWWNPATEAQAVDRIHRIGQTRNVMVYRLIAKDTIEEKVMALKARKAALFSSVMDDGERSAPPSTPTTSAPCSPEAQANSWPSAARKPRPTMRHERLRCLCAAHVPAGRAGRRSSRGGAPGRRRLRGGQLVGGGAEDPRARPKLGLVPIAARQLRDPGRGGDGHRC